MSVIKCVCYDVTLAEMREHHEANGSDFDELQRVFGCGRACGFCRPYIHEMLRTGRTRFAPGECTADPTRERPRPRELK